MILFLAFCVPFLGVVTTTSLTAPPYPLVSVKFEVNPANTSRLLAELIDSEWFARYEPDATANQLLINTNLQELTYEQWLSIQRASKLNFSRVDIAKMKEVVRTLHIDTTKEYSDFTKTVPNAATVMSSVLQLFKVNEGQFMFYMVLNQVGSEEFLDYFKAGNFSADNWRTFRQLTGKTEQELFRICKTMAMSYMRNVSLVDFSRMLRNITGELRSATDDYEGGQVGILKAAFDVLEVYTQDVFGRLVAKYNTTLNEELMLSTRVARNQYLTADVVQENIDLMSKEKFSRCYLRAMDGQRIEIGNVSRLNGARLVNITTSDGIPFVAPQTEVWQTTNCYYATNVTKLVSVIVSSTKSGFTVKKSLEARFVPGGPLFCDDQLVGIALSDTFDSIAFARLDYKTPEQNGPFNPIPPVIIQEPNRDFLMTLNFGVNSAKIPELIAYLLLNATNSTAGNIRQMVLTSDLVTAYKLQNLNYGDFKIMLNGTGHSAFPYAITEALYTLGIPVKSTFEEFVMRINNMFRMDSMLAAVGVDPQAVHKTLLFDKEDDRSFLEVMARGKYEKRFVISAVNASGLTEDEIFDFLKDIIIREAPRIPLWKFLEFLQNNGGYPAMTKVISQLAVGAESFRTPIFKMVLNNFEGVLRNASALASAISRYHLISTNDIYDLYNDNITRSLVHLQAECVATPGNIYNVSKVTPYYAGYANLTLDKKLAKDHLLPIAVGVSTQPKNCFLVTDDGVWRMERVKSVHAGYEVVVDGTLVARYKLGAALVCQDRLYGVATHLTGNIIEFGGFRNPQIIYPNGPSAAGGLHCNWVMATLLSVVVMFMSKF